MVTMSEEYTPCAGGCWEEMREAQEARQEQLRAHVEARIQSENSPQEAIEQRAQDGEVNYVISKPEEAPVEPSKASKSEEAPAEAKSEEKAAEAPVEAEPEPTEPESEVVEVEAEEKPAKKASAKTKAASADK